MTSTQTAGGAEVGPILLVGCGKMGGAMLAGWRAAGIGPVVVVDPMAAVSSDPDVTVVASIEAVDPGFSPAVLILAVKPQMMDAALPAYRRYVDRPDGKLPLVLSIAAGKTIDYFSQNFGSGVPIVRAMPNLPASIGEGATVAVGNGSVTPAQRAAADRLLAVCGSVAWVEDEALIDAVTAVSGGGPAYVFLMVEALAEAARAAGLPEPLASELARTTVVGAGALLRASDLPAGKLREAVTSPGGTTRAALDVLMGPDGLSPLMVKAVAAAAARSRELGRPG